MSCGMLFRNLNQVARNGTECMASGVLTPAYGIGQQSAVLAVLSFTDNWTA